MATIGLKFIIPNRNIKENVMVEFSDDSPCLYANSLKVSFTEVYYFRVCVNLIIYFVSFY